MSYDVCVKLKHVYLIALLQSGLGSCPLFDIKKTTPKFVEYYLYLHSTYLIITFMLSFYVTIIA